jgi:DNA-binding transcriptional LysR family regulator
MPNPRESTGNMIQDLMSQDPAVSELVDALDASVASERQLTEQRRVVIVGAGGHTAAVSQRMAEFMRALPEGGDVVVLDSVPEELRDSQLDIVAPRLPGTGSPWSLRRREVLLLEDLNFGSGALAALADAPFQKKQPPAPKEKTLADFQAMVKAQAKRDRKAAKLRGRK